MKRISLCFTIFLIFNTGYSQEKSVTFLNIKNPTKTIKIPFYNESIVIKLKNGKKYSGIITEAKDDSVLIFRTQNTDTISKVNSFEEYMVYQKIKRTEIKSLRKDKTLNKQKREREILEIN